MEDKGYSVEYVPPKDNRTILQEFFKQVQEKISIALPGYINASLLQEVIEDNDTYSYKIPINDSKGVISFEYDDYIPDFDSFEDYMHSGSSDRGRLKVDIIMRVPLSEDTLYAQVLKKLDEKEIPDVTYEKRKDYVEISASQSGGIYLLSPDEDDVHAIYNGVMNLWNQLKLFMDTADGLSES